MWGRLHGELEKFLCGRSLKVRLLYVMVRMTVPACRYETPVWHMAAYLHSLLYHPHRRPATQRRRCISKCIRDMNPLSFSSSASDLYIPVPLTPSIIMSSFTKFLTNLKSNQNTNFAETSGRPNLTKDDSVIAPTKELESAPPRRWSYVTYLNEGTLHGDADNLMLGL